MEAIRKIVKSKDDKITIELPESFCDRDLEIIILTSAENRISGKKRHGYGTLKGKITIPDTFFEPLPEDVLKAFGVL